MAFSLFLFIYSVLLFLVRTYIPGVTFLHLVLLIVSFVVINFFIFLTFLVSLICKCFICSNRKKSVKNRFLSKFKEDVKGIKNTKELLIKVLLALQRVILKVFKKPHFNLFGKNY